MNKKLSERKSLLEVNGIGIIIVYILVVGFLGNYVVYGIIGRRRDRRLCRGA